MRKYNALALVLTALLAGCNASANTMSGPAERAADATTKAIYNNDAIAAAANFDDQLKDHVTRASVGAFSDRFNKLGPYKGLTLTSSDVNKGEFTYRADFETGSIGIAVRIDKNGQLAAYRVYPGT